MSEENANPDVDEVDDADEENTGTDDTGEQDDGGEDDKKVDPEVAKAIARRDRALKRAQRAEAERDELKKKLEGGEKDEDPVAKANARLVSASARTVLASAGVTDKDDQKTILGVLRLDDIEVDDDGPDEEAIEERIEELRRIFGAAPSKRTPKTVRTQDRGGKGDTTTDPDAARYRRILRRPT